MEVLDTVNCCYFGRASITSGEVIVDGKSTGVTSVVQNLCADLKRFFLPWTQMESYHEHEITTEKRARESCILQYAYRVLHTFYPLPLVAVGRILRLRSKLTTPLGRCATSTEPTPLVK